MFKISQNKPALSWAFYDWANSAFATTVMAGFFPVFFKQYWAQDLSAVDSTFWLGLANSAAALLIVILSPILGLLCDQLGIKKRLLIVFALLGIVMTAGLFWVQQGQWVMAIVFYLFAVVGFSGGNVAYDALLVDVSAKSQLEKWSARGFSLGYLGGGVLFAINIAMVMQPTWFGLADASSAVQTAFLLVAIWWLVFSLPLLLFVDENVTEVAKDKASTNGLIRGLVNTFTLLKRYPHAAYFLLAYWFYIDGVDTIVRMAVDYGMAIGFDSNGLLAALLVTQLVGFPATLLFGTLGSRYGAKQMIALAILIYCIVVIWAWQMTAQWEFYALAVTIGLVQGGVQSMSRALFARIIPQHSAGRFFGLFNMMGKFAAIIGPMLVASVGVATGNPRDGILSVLLLFIAGAWFLAKVDVIAGQKMATEA